MGIAQLQRGLAGLELSYGGRVFASNQKVQVYAGGVTKWFYQIIGEQCTELILDIGCLSNAKSFGY